MADDVVTEQIDVGSVYPGTGTSDQGLGDFSVGGDFTIPDYTPTVNTSTNVPGAITPVAAAAATVTVSSTVASPKKLLSTGLVQPTSYQTPTAVQPTPTAIVSTGGVITMDQLIKVSNAIGLTDECQDMPILVKVTGLDESTIIKCVDWLNSQGLVSKSATLVCGVAAVKKLQAQLKSFS